MVSNDKRARERRQVLIPVKVYDLSRETVIKCDIEDATKDGCMIVTNEVQNLPDKIILKFVKFKGEREGRVVWRGLEKAGVRFIDGEELTPAKF